MVLGNFQCVLRVWKLVGKVPSVLAISSWGLYGYFIPFIPLFFLLSVEDDYIKTKIPPERTVSPQNNHPINPGLH